MKIDSNKSTDIIKNCEKVDQLFLNGNQKLNQERKKMEPILKSRQEDEKSILEKS